MRSSLQAGKSAFDEMVKKVEKNPGKYILRGPERASTKKDNATGDLYYKNQCQPVQGEAKDPGRAGLDDNIYFKKLSSMDTLAAAAEKIGNLMMAVQILSA